MQLKCLPLIILLITTIVSVGCFNGKLIVDGTDRTYTIHTPKGYSNKEKPYPVLFVFHGNPSNGWQMKLYTKLNKTANKNNFIIVYPNAIDKRWDYNKCKTVVKDVQFIKELINELNKNYHIDTSRLYFSGMSGGGFFLSALAHAIPDKIAALAVVAGSTINPKYVCKGEDLKTPIPFLLIQGDADFLYGGDKKRGIFSAHETINYWVKLNQCDTIPTITDLPDINKKDSSSVSKFHYAPKSGKDVVFYKVKNGGHHWPNSAFNANTFVKVDLGQLNKDMDTNQIIWDFVSSHKTITPKPNRKHTR